jgi:hypothetical protein
MGKPTVFIGYNHKDGEQDRAQVVALAEQVPGDELPRREEHKDELPEFVPADDRSGVGCVAPGWVRRSPSYPHDAGSNNNAHKHAS